MAKVNGRLTVTLHEAKELHAEDFGKMDPYCKVELVKQQYKTKVHKKGGSQAKWGQSFTFHLLNVGPNEVVHFQVWDEDLLSDDKIGRADLPLSVLAEHTDKKDGAWIQLVDFDNFKKIAGYVRIGVKFEGSGWPKEEQKVKPPSPKHERPPSPKHEKPPSPKHHKPPSPKHEKPPSPKHHHDHHEPPKHEHDKHPVIVIQPVYIQVTVQKDVKLADTLHEDHKLIFGEQINSPNGEYTAVMQFDGNFVVYHEGTPVWASKTAGTGADLIQLQSDNNLVIYDISGSSPVPHWATGTSGQGKGKSRLTIQNDGNLVLRDGEDTVLWETGVPEPPKYSDTLNIGETLEGGDLIRSSNGEFQARFQRDGNFVVYQGKEAKWASRTNGTGANKIILQNDHNLVVYGTDGAKWATGTAGKGSTARLVMQNDGNLVLYDGKTPLWASHGLEKKEVDHLEIGGRLGVWEKLTSSDGRWTAVFQKDGNFVVSEEGKAKWSTRTNGTGANHIVLQGDHNLVVYAGTAAKWSTKTHGKGSTARLLMQNDGNLVLYDGTAVLWARR